MTDKSRPAPSTRASNDPSSDPAADPASDPTSATSSGPADVPTGQAAPPSPPPTSTPNSTPNSTLNSTPSFPAPNQAPNSPSAPIRTADLGQYEDVTLEQAALRSDRFRLQREGDWKRLDLILRKIEGGRARKLSDADVLDLPALYRMAASSLSVARETSLDASTLHYLESLVQRGWYQVYGPSQGFLMWLRHFLRGGLSSSIRAIWLDICIALFVMVGGAVTGWLLVSRDVSWYDRLIPPALSQGRDPDASREQLLEGLAPEENTEGLSTFAAMLFTNNAGVCILAFALGFAFGIPSMLLLIHNMAVLGAMLWLYHNADLTWEFVAWLSVHGTTELFGILLAGAAGMHIGRKMAFPGKQSIMAAAAAGGQRAAQVMVGVVLMMVCAAVLEAFPRQLAGSEARAIIGLFMLLFWLCYFFLYGSERGLGRGLGRGSGRKATPKTSPSEMGSMPHGATGERA